jgi:hypothetical protein
LESGPAANRTIHDKLLAALQAHEHPIIVLRNATVGHAVVAYNMVDNADSSFNIWVYDSNAPYGSNEPTGALSSVIRVNPDGTWSLPSTGISGSRSGLLVLRLADLPSNPHMYNVPAFAGSLLIGAPGQTTTQVTDAAGHTMFDAAGNLNADPTTHIDGMPYVPATDGTQPIDRQMFVFPHGEQTLTPTITADRSGQASITELSAGDQSTVQVSGRPGAQDQISLAPGTGSVSVAGTPAAVSFDVEQQTTTGLEHVNVTSAGGSAPTLTVDHSGAVSFGSASPAKVNITVSRVPTHGVPTSVSAKRVTVGPNAKLTISARGTSLRLGHQKLGTARSSAGPRGAVSQLQIQARAGKLIANSTASLPRGSEGATFIWQLSRHGRPVLSRTVRLDPRRRTAAVRLSLPIRQTAGLVLTGRLIVVTERGHFPVMGVTARSAALRNVILAR